MLDRGGAIRKVLKEVKAIAGWVVVGVAVTEGKPEDCSQT